MNVSSKENLSNKADCLVCGAEIRYLNYSTDFKCYYCGLKEKEAHFCCMEGHYICNTCHTNDALKLIESVSIATDSDSPFIIAERLMKHPSVHMHGPEHHALVPAVLIAAYQNYMGYENESTISEAIKRGKKIPGGYCGFYGACGGGIGVGIAVSILLDATPLTPQPRSHANWATSCTLNSIADAGGARCCKKSIRVSLKEGVIYLSNLFGLSWDDELDFSVKCNYHTYNRECDKNCEYNDN
ncbi:MAG: radical SAM domain-containing protein [Methanohalophilus sp.]|jgi:hypothetical protein|nr:MAG: radical SAM domain-containing protein [Methanohalophilus sp.]